MNLGIDLFSSVTQYFFLFEIKKSVTRYGRSERNDSNYGWFRCGVSLTIGILVLSCFLGLGFLLWLNSLSYGAVYLWAYTGILSNHLSKNGWGGFADSVLFTLCIAMLVISAGMCLVIYRKQKRINMKE